MKSSRIINRIFHISFFLIICFILLESVSYSSQCDPVFHKPGWRQKLLYLDHTYKKEIEELRKKASSQSEQNRVKALIDLAYTCGLHCNVEPLVTKKLDENIIISYREEQIVEFSPDISWQESKEIAHTILTVFKEVAGHNMIRKFFLFSEMVGPLPFFGKLKPVLYSRDKVRLAKVHRKNRKDQSYEYGFGDPQKTHIEILLTQKWIDDVMSSRPNVTLEIIGLSASLEYIKQIWEAIREFGRKADQRTIFIKFKSYHNDKTAELFPVRKVDDHYQVEVTIDQSFDKLRLELLEAFDPSIRIARYKESGPHYQKLMELAHNALNSEDEILIKNLILLARTAGFIVIKPKPDPMRPYAVEFFNKALDNMNIEVTIPKKRRSWIIADKDRNLIVEIVKFPSIPLEAFDAEYFTERIIDAIVMEAENLRLISEQTKKIKPKYFPEIKPSRVNGHIIYASKDDARGYSVAMFQDQREKLFLRFTNLGNPKLVNWKEILDDISQTAEILNTKDIIIYTESRAQEDNGDTFIFETVPVSISHEQLMERLEK